MDYHEILDNIHAGGYEFDVLEYLSHWVKEYIYHKEIENCHLRSSLDLIKKFNNEKWHFKVIDSLTTTDCLEDLYGHK